MRKVIVSTGNPHKLDEIKNMIGQYQFDVLSKNEVGYHDFEVLEDGQTLEENAIKKARELWNETKEIVIADDTGLFVEYLKGEPGVHSSRYAGEHATDEENNQLLLEKMKHAINRRAFFKTVIVIVDEKGETYLAEGICHGQIGYEPKGDKGFGYDSLFIVEDLNKTFAEMSQKEKNQYSHRGNALRNMERVFGDMVGNENISR